MIVGQYVTQQKAYGEPKRGVVEQIISTDKDDNEIEMAQVAWDDGTTDWWPVSGLRIVGIR